MKIRILENEYWWGGRSYDGDIMPFSSKTEYLADLRDSCPNQAMPLFLSSKGRCIQSDAPFTIHFSNGEIHISNIRSEVNFSTLGSTLKECYLRAAQLYFNSNGKAPDTAVFEYPMYGTWIEIGPDLTQEKVMRYAKNIIDSGLEPGAIIIDDNWMSKYGEWLFDLNKFPNPKQMIDLLHDMGFKVMLWFCPYVVTEGDTYIKLKNSDLLLKKKNGEPKILPWWSGHSCIFDLSNPKSITYMQKKLDFLVETYGVDGFKLDAGKPEIFEKDNFEEYNWHTPIMPGQDCANYCSLGLKYGFSEIREGYFMAGKGIISRQQDKEHSWGKNGLADIIPKGIAQSMTGYVYHCPDMVGGGELGPTIDNQTLVDTELFVRYMQASALFPIIQFSRLPDSILKGEDLTIFLNILKLRKSFMPYLLSLVEQSKQTCEPIFTPLEYHYPGCGLEEITKQFCLGEDVIVAPVLEKGATEIKVFLPQGEYIGFNKKIYTVIQPSELFTVPVTIKDLPYFIKKDSIHKFKYFQGKV